MTVSNIGLACVVFKSFGKTNQSVMNEVLPIDIIDENKIRKLIHGRCKSKDKIAKSLKT